MSYFLLQRYIFLYGINISKAHNKYFHVFRLHDFGLRMVALAYNEYYLSLFRCFPNLIANPLSKSRWAFIRNCFLVFSTAFLPFAALPYGQIRRHEPSVRRECPVRQPYRL